MAVLNARRLLHIIYQEAAQVRHIARPGATKYPSAPPASTSGLLSLLYPRQQSLSGILGTYASRIRSRSFSAHSIQQLFADGNSILVRDFIHSALYNPQFGYFASSGDVVGTVGSPIPFQSFSGRHDYVQAVGDLYKRGGKSWFTPVELFQPWYGFAIAEYILQTSDPKVPLKIYEIGGGMGGCALNILDYIKARAPSSVYETMSYTSVEISRFLAEKQIARVGTVKSHQKRFYVENRSALERSGWGYVDTGPCFIIMLEVLDNLPHDLVCKPTPTSPWMEVTLSQKQDGGQVSEVYRPLQDVLIKQCLDIITSSAKSTGAYSWVSIYVKRLLSRLISQPEFAWIPTGCLHLLDTLHHLRPNMSLISADFTTLPGVKVVGERAPLVATKDEGVTTDLATYLDAKGDGDIFFPTDFVLLQKLDQLCAIRSSSQVDSVKSNAQSRLSTIITSSKFMEMFADTEKTQTLDGYNPLLEDFSNTNFFLSLPPYPT